MTAKKPDPVYGTKSKGDSYVWTLDNPVIERMRSDLDFIGFQEVVGQFSRDIFDTSHFLKFSEKDIGLADFAERTINYTRYLKETFGLPVFVPYLSVATSTWTDTNQNGIIEDAEVTELGWVDQAASVYAQLKDARASLRDVGMFGLCHRAILDDPTNDLRGYQFFQQNEYALGLVDSNAPNGVVGQPIGGEISLKWDREGRSLLSLMLGN